MEACNQHKKDIYFFDHDNNNLRPLGDNEATPITITNIDRPKIGLTSLWLSKFNNHNLAINDNSIKCLPAYPSCTNLIACLNEHFADHEQKQAIINFLDKSTLLEKELFFWQRSNFSKKNVILVHNSLISKTIHTSHIVDTKTGITNIYYGLLWFSIALGLASAEKLFVESNLLQAILFFIPAFLLFHGTKDNIEKVNRIII